MAMLNSNRKELHNRPADPTDLLPEQSMLSLSEYLSMQAAMGDRTRFEIVYRLTYTTSMTVDELAAVMQPPVDAIETAVEHLVDVGLIQRRQTTKRGTTDIQTYYASTSLGEDILSDGVLTLIDREREFETVYGASTRDDRL